MNCGRSYAPILKRLLLLWRSQPVVNAGVHVRCSYSGSVHRGLWQGRSLKWHGCCRTPAWRDHHIALGFIQISNGIIKVWLFLALPGDGPGLFATHFVPHLNFVADSYERTNSSVNCMSQCPHSSIFIYSRTLCFLHNAIDTFLI